MNFLKQYWIVLVVTFAAIILAMCVPGTYLYNQINGYHNLNVKDCPKSLTVVVAGNNEYCVPAANIKILH